MSHERTDKLRLLHVGWVRVLPELRPRDLRRDALTAANRDEVRIVSEDQRRLANLRQKVADVYFFQHPEVLDTDGLVNPACNSCDV